MFQSDATQPYDTVLIKTGGNYCPVLSATADAASLVAGGLCTNTATSEPSEMTLMGAVSGNTPLNSEIYIIEIDRSSPNIAYGTDAASISYADNDDIKVYELKVNMEVWCKANNLTAAIGEILVPAANGLVTNAGDPDGTAIDETCHGFLLLSAIAGGTWVPCRYIGYHTHDKTA
jgi:hypothetical protein